MKKALSFFKRNKSSNSKSKHKVKKPEKQLDHRSPTFQTNNVFFSNNNTSPVNDDHKEHRERDPAQRKISIRSISDLEDITEESEEDVGSSSMNLNVDEIISAGDEGGVIYDEPPMRRTKSSSSESSTTSSTSTSSSSSGSSSGHFDCGKYVASYLMLIVIHVSVGYTVCNPILKFEHLRLTL